MNLEGKTAIITGASRGLGAAVSEKLIAKGMTVYALARSKDKLDKYREKLGENYHPVKMDITQHDDIKNWVESTFSNDFLPDILINNAGIGSFHKIDDISDKDWLDMINTNLNGTFYITTEIVKLMKKGNSSRHIINIGSILGTVGREGGAAYCASKYGIRGFGEALYKELRYDGIKVTNFNPGSIETDFLSSSGIVSHDNMLYPSDVADTIVHVLETPDNMLINEIIVRPLNPKMPN